jgi:hypothetical protein
MQTSRGKFDNLHRTPAEFTTLDLDGYGFRCLWPTHPARTASYPVSVRQVTALLNASLEPCLTAALLRFANTSPPSGCVEDLHLQVAEHARHTKKGLQAVNLQPYTLKCKFGWYINDTSVLCTPANAHRTQQNHRYQFRHPC